MNHPQSGSTFFIDIGSMCRNAVDIKKISPRWLINTTEGNKKRECGNPHTPVSGSKEYLPCFHFLINLPVKFPILRM